MRCAAISSDDLELFVLSRLPHTRAALVTSHLRTCRTCNRRRHSVAEEIATLQAALVAYGLEELVPDTSAPREWTAPREQRTAERVPASGDVAISCPTDALGWPSIPATLIDRSEGGFGIRTACQMAQGLRVAVHHGASCSLALVRHCTPQGDHYRVGLQVLAA
jgi:anti-sigma factor RsiW